MTKKITFTARIGCEKTGEEYSINGELDRDFFIRSDDNRIHNHMLVLLLQEYPHIHVGEMIDQSIDMSPEVAQDRDDYERLVA